MIRASVRFFFALLVSSLWLTAVQVVNAEDVVAVLSAASGPYQAAYESFLKDFGQPVASFHLPGDKPSAGPKTRVIVAFGGEAAVQSYPERATLIACLAPGLPMSSPHGGPFTFVAMKPPADVLIAQLRNLQPGLKRLAVFWNSPYTANYLKELKRHAAAEGINILDTRVSTPDGIPNALRALPGKADALWLAPDPNLVTQETFQTIKQFSWDNAIPFYAPTAGLAAAGATASVSVSAQETGHQAAELARQALAGATLPTIAYSTKTELTVNLESAIKAGLAIPPEALSRADKVIR